MRGLRASALAISTIWRRDSGRSLTSADGWMSTRRRAPAPPRRCGRCALAVDHAEALRRVGNDDVVGDAEFGDQRQLLEDADDAGLVGLGRRGEVHLLPIQHHAALVGRDDARHDLDQRRLAGAVFAQDGMDAAARDTESSASSSARTPP